ncbi:hypothetical protein ScPMuIL_018577 [Solemya velum]
MSISADDTHHGNFLVDSTKLVKVRVNTRKELGFFEIKLGERASRVQLRFVSLFHVVLTARKLSRYGYTQNKLPLKYFMMNTGRRTYKDEELRSESFGPRHLENMNSTLASISFAKSSGVCDLGLRDQYDDLTSLQTDFWNWRMLNSPEFATSIGEYKYNDQLISYNHTLFDVRKAKVDDFLDKLSSISINGLTKAQIVDYRILNDSLWTYREGYRWRMYGSLNPVSFIEGPQTDPSYITRTTPFNNRGDFENFIVRIEKSPNQIEEIKGILEMAIKLNRTLHIASVNRIPGQLGKLLPDEPAHFPYYSPFNETLAAVTSIPETIKQDLRKRARSAIAKYIYSLKQLKVFLEKQYIPKARSDYGVHSWPNGREYYNACLKWHLSLDVSPADVHTKGREEVARIHARMKSIMAKLGHTMSVRDFFKYIKDSGNFTIKSASVLQEAFQTLITDRINPKLQRVFLRVPDLPVVVEPMPTDGPTGMYLPGNSDGSRPGIFQINLFRPEDQPTFDMMALTLHEVNPGHHFQASWVFNAKLPEFRKNPDYSHYYAVPFNFPFYTAYTEGWALYAELLGEEMGLYKDDYELMGRYSAEIFRACRLVVDTGLHYYGWSKEEAFEYMRNYTAYSESALETEISRYITWPGQACAYKMGEIKIRELRETARRRIGSKFDLKAFHSVILSNGAMPLNILETIVDDWIEIQNTPGKTDSIESRCIIFFVHVFLYWSPSFKLQIL